MRMNSEDKPDVESTEEKGKEEDETSNEQFDEMSGILKYEIGIKCQKPGLGQAERDSHQETAGPEKERGK